jgi:hypothetical protein
VAMAKKMSPEEQRFSFLNNAFVYKKVNNTSDALFKKLVKMIEEQVKKEKKKKGVEEEVEVLDDETAHLVTAVAKRDEEGQGQKEEKEFVETSVSMEANENMEANKNIESNIEVEPNNSVESFVETSMEEEEEAKVEGGVKKMKRIRKSVTKRIKR